METVLESCLEVSLMMSCCLFDFESFFSDIAAQLVKIQMQL